MNNEMTISEAREALTALPGRIGSKKEVVEVTRRGKPVLAILPWEMYEGIVETLEIAADSKLMGLLRKSIAEMEKGKTVPWKKVKKDTGL